MRDVAVIGWGRPGEKRISFIKLIRAELGIGLADAKARFEQLLETGEPLVVPASTGRAAELARECHGLGGEVRLLCGHANPSVPDLRANDELADIERQLGEIQEDVARRDWMSAIEGVRPDLRVSANRSAGYELARENCTAVGRYRLEPQPASDWSGEVDLPPALVTYYAEFGPKNLSLDAYGNPFFLPGLKGLWNYQAGYRWSVSASGAEQARDEQWDDDWLVVADGGADPFILSRSTGRVLYAMHGSGSWEPEELFDDLGQMAATLTAIGGVCASAARDLTDDDSLIRPRWRAFLEADIDAALGSYGRAPDVLATLGLG